MTGFYVFGETVNVPTGVGNGARCRLATPRSFELFCLQSINTSKNLKVQ